MHESFFNLIEYNEGNQKQRENKEKRIKLNVMKRGFYNLTKGKKTWNPRLLGSEKEMNVKWNPCAFIPLSSLAHHYIAKVNSCIAYN